MSDPSPFPPTAVLECGYCGNVTPHTLIFEHAYPMLFEQFDDEIIDEEFTWLCYSCGTCGGVNIFGDFYIGKALELPRSRLHPKASSILPPAHLSSPPQPLPEKIYNVYREVWPLRHRSPAAFVAQVRRLLEHICADKGAVGEDLYHQLDDLIKKGVFPGCFSEMTDLLRKVGNLGAHASTKDLDIWDAELVDDVFRSVIDVVYIAPAKLERMKQRMKAHLK